MSSSYAEGVRRYFTEQEWLKLPEYMKLRYGNIKENYDKMVALGLQPPIPEFMNAKPAARNCPAKSKSCGSRSRKVKRTSNDSQPGSKTTGKSPVRRSTRVQARTAHVSKDQGARANPPSVSRYPKRKLKNIKYTESEDPWDDENASRKAPTIAQVPRPTRKVPARRPQNTAPGSDQHRCRYGCYHDDPSECPVHGPSFYVVGVPLEDFERAKKSLPKGLVVLRSKIKGAQLGIFAIEPLPEGHCFGPYANSSAKHNVSQLREEETGERKLSPYCETAGKTAGETAGETTGEARPETARWIRYVNCAPSELQCNVVVLQDDGFVFYQTCRPVEPSDELMVWCGRDKTGAHRSTV
ncbi:histone-lysine N-methyltransferase PRDM9-like [Rhipicephalus microplus]|uniref:histone-lysine N-methyltransferase PRDM9-like n=1 Tax=Rhipicephalus microplus TaxID=6941 RepID=UPI003F6A6271